MSWTNSTKQSTRLMSTKIRNKQQLIVTQNRKHTFIIYNTGFPRYTLGLHSQDIPRIAKTWITWEHLLDTIICFWVNFITKQRMNHLKNWVWKFFPFRFGDKDKFNGNRADSDPTLDGNVLKRVHGDVLAQDFGNGVRTPHNPDCRMACCRTHTLSRQSAWQ